MMQCAVKRGAAHIVELYPKVKRIIAQLQVFLRGTEDAVPYDVC